MILLGLLAIGWATASLSAQSAARTAPATNTTRADAWRFTVEIHGRSTFSDAPAVVDSVVIGTALIRGRDARFDIVRSNTPEFPAGGWLLTADGGRSLIAVDPAARRFRTVPSASATKDLNSSKFVSIAVSGLVARGDTLGACGMVDGHATSCYRLTRDYVITQRYFFIRRAAKIHEEMQFWVASDLPNMENPVARFFTESSPFVFDDPDNVLRARRVEDNLFGGVPLKVELNATQSELGRSTPRTSTNMNSVEIRNIERTAADPSRFDIPADYRLRKQ